MPAKKYYKPRPLTMRPCAVCGRVTQGKTTKLYCSNACRQRAKRAR